VDHDGPSHETIAPAVVSSRHVIDLPSGPLAYRADAGTVPVRRDDGSALADVFYVAYRAEPAANTWWEATPFGGPRPITFAFNGGPGSASLRLNIGGFGPRRAPTKTPQHTPPAPYQFGDNPYTLLPSTDLVFLDAPETGFSRISPGARPEEAWGVDQDVEIFARAITRYLTITTSWQAPRYLLGESYGSARAAALVCRLQNQGLDFNGVILLSAMLNWATTQPGLDQGYINLLPSYAAAAHYHGKTPGGSEQDLDAVLTQTRRFAASTYAQALQLGDRLPADKEDEVATLLSQYTGLDAALLRKCRLRVEVEDFRTLLLAGEGKVIGRFDTRCTAQGHYAAGTSSFGTGSAGIGSAGTASQDPATNDAATAGVDAAHLAGFHHHLAHDLGYHSSLHYRPSHDVTIEGAWDWRHKAPGIEAPLAVPNVSLDLAAAMRRNPALRVRVMGGFYDLATPFAGAEFDVSHLYLGPALRPNVTFKWYKSGHMTFVDEEAIAEMSGDLREFYAEGAHDGSAAKDSAAKGRATTESAGMGSAGGQLG
jgi:carboxypeptidase C (cathepsin A)